MAEDATFSSNETELYLGSAPSEQDQDIIPSFTASGFVPLGWFFFFKPDDILNRESVNPKSWQGLISEDTNFTEVGADSVDQYMKEPIISVYEFGMLSTLRYKALLYVYAKVYSGFT